MIVVTNQSNLSDHHSETLPWPSQPDFLRSRPQGLGNLYTAPRAIIRLSMLVGAAGIKPGPDTLWPADLTALVQQSEGRSHLQLITKLCHPEHSGECNTITRSQTDTSVGTSIVYLIFYIKFSIIISRNMLSLYNYVCIWLILKTSFTKSDSCLLSIMFTISM